MWRLNEVLKGKVTLWGFKVSLAFIWNVLWKIKTKWIIILLTINVIVKMNTMPASVSMKLLILMDSAYKQIYKIWTGAKIVFWHLIFSVCFYNRRRQHACTHTHTHYIKMDYCEQSELMRWVLDCDTCCSSRKESDSWVYSTAWRTVDPDMRSQQKHHELGTTAFSTRNASTSSSIIIITKSSTNTTNHMQFITTYATASTITTVSNTVHLVDLYYYYYYCHIKFITTIISA